VIGYRTITSGAGRELDTDILQIRTGYRTNASGVGKEPDITTTTGGGRYQIQNHRCHRSEAGRESDTSYRTITSGSGENRKTHHNQ
jgi:hypothetical protein